MSANEDTNSDAGNDSDFEDFSPVDTLLTESQVDQVYKCLFRFCFLFEMLERIREIGVASLGTC